MKIDTSSKSEQRKFGLVMAAAFTVLGLLSWWHRGMPPRAVFYIAAAFLVSGLVYPSALRPVLALWLKFSEVLNWVMTRVLLISAFYLLIVPGRFILWVRGIDPLKRTWEPTRESYWEEPEAQPSELPPYRNQF